LGKRLE